MKKLVIRQSSSRISHAPSKNYVDNILSKNVNIPYNMKCKGKNTLSILFQNHIDLKTCQIIAKKLGLEVLSISDSRCILNFPY